MDSLTQDNKNVYTGFYLVNTGLCQTDNSLHPYKDLPNKTFYLIL